MMSKWMGLVTLALAMLLSVIAKKKSRPTVPVPVVVTTVTSEVPACSHPGLPKPIEYITCAVETGKWNVSEAAMKNVGCLLGGKNRCHSPVIVPLEREILPSRPPPNSIDPNYHRLVTIAEKAVPTTWWRLGFDNDRFMFTRDEQELPLKLLHLQQPQNVKLRNFYYCVTQQQFIRTPFLGNETASSANDCPADNSHFSEFFSLWTAHHATLGGTDSEAKSSLLLSSTEVLQYFLDHYGEKKDSCNALKKTIHCRGALAAAALVNSAHFLTAMIGKHRHFSESKLTRGFMLASLGRALLHGDSTATGNTPITAWQMRIDDFTALQQAYLKLYTDSFGAMYTVQLTKHVPLAFAPNFTVTLKEPRWSALAPRLEPIYTSLRNWMHQEADTNIDFGPYIPLVAFPEVRSVLQNKPHNRRVLVDIGANGFFASPKYLLDSYAVHLPFTHAVMVDPEPHFPASVPKAYQDRYNITFLPLYAEIGTDTESDVLKLLPTLVTKEDFVVLKFDVDPNTFAFGPTMEWGLLFSLMQHHEVGSLIDELYIELHFFLPMLHWVHYHSNWEALDTLRYLRAQGMIVHAWP